MGECASGREAECQAERMVRVSHRGDSEGRTDQSTFTLGCARACSQGQGKGTVHGDGPRVRPDRDYRIAH